MERMEQYPIPESEKSVLEIPQRTIFALCGPAGSGKSTFAKNLIAQQSNTTLKPTMIVSSDACRALVCDDESNQHVNAQSFAIFYALLDKRMQLNRFIIADSTALLSNARSRLLTLARKYNYTTYLLLFDVPEERCLLNNQLRNRQVEPKVIPYHKALFQQALQAIPDEGWENIIHLDYERLQQPFRIMLL